MKGIILFFVGTLVFITIILMIIFHKAVRAWKIFRSTAERNAERASRKAAKEEEYFRRTSNKQYREDNKPKFDKDYFKSADDSQDKKASAQQRARQTGGQQQTKERPQAARKTTTNEGVTIIDHRDESASHRKIFSENEGEYTDFVEVN